MNHFLKINIYTTERKKTFEYVKRVLADKKINIIRSNPSRIITDQHQIYITSANDNARGNKSQVSLYTHEIERDYINKFIRFQTCDYKAYEEKRETRVFVGSIDALYFVL